MPSPRPSNTVELRVAKREGERDVSEHKTAQTNMPERDYVNDAMDQIIRQCEIAPADRDAIRKIIDAAVSDATRFANGLANRWREAWREAVEAFMYAFGGSNPDKQDIRAAEKRLALAALDATPTSPIMLPECPNCEHTNWGAICGVCGYDIRDARTVRALAQAGDDAVVLRQEQVRQVRDVIQCYLRPDDLCREQVLQALALLPVTP